MKLYEKIAHLIAAYKHCLEVGNEEWATRHVEGLLHIEREVLPSGAGIDNGCTFRLDHSDFDKIVIQSSFHVLNDQGVYDGWVNFTVTLIPSFISNFGINIEGVEDESLNEYLSGLFNDTLSEQYE